MPINYDKDGNYVPSQLQVTGYDDYHAQYLFAKIKGILPKVYLSRFAPWNPGIHDSWDTAGGHEIREQRDMDEAEYIRYLVTKKREQRTGIKENHYEDDEGVV